VKAARALGADACVKKPYVIEKLGLAVRKELDRTKCARKDDVSPLQVIFNPFLSSIVWISNLHN
jgi:DNA-binding response OmpR family regulator